MGYLSHLLTHLLTSRTAPEALDNRRWIYAGRVRDEFGATPG
nr:MAG TPA: hypothetical protein [Caudoviricetes sp.]